MSNERSPREVCSITIGMRGLMSGWVSLAAGGPQFRLGLWFFLVGCPDSLACLGLLGRNALDLLRDSVERTRHAHRFALGLERAGLPRLLEHCIGVVEAIAERFLDLLLGDVDSELVGRRLQHELAGDGRGGLLAQPRDEVLRRLAGEL